MHGQVEYHGHAGTEWGRNAGEIELINELFY